MLLADTYIGVDEAGRGPWAGPVVAAAVILAPGTSILGLGDSKQLSAKRREKLFGDIQRQAVAIGVGWVHASAIDSQGLSAAVCLAMRLSVDSIGHHQFEKVIIDGNINYLSDQYDCEAIIKADQKLPNVSAASIIAKVMRDRFMRAMHLKYPVYGFDRHMGYGTAHHREALQLHGVSKLHRRSFRPILELL